MAAQLLLAACGSASPAPPEPPTADAQPAAPAGAAAPAPADARVDNGARAQRREAVTRGRGPVRAVAPPGDDADAGTIHEPVSGANPCKLVTRSEARRIVGRPVSAPSLGAQGPTCVYASRDSRQSITLAVQPVSVDALTRGRRDLIDVPMRGRTAVCVSAGGQRLLVPLAGGRVLGVDGPCALATRFALKALGRMAG